MNDEERCVYCERLLTEETGKHRDHLIPKSRGGSDDVENCVVACATCNMNKRDKTPSEWHPTGLPSWVYEKEIKLAIKYRMPARGVKKIIGYGLLVTRTPICLEFHHGICGRPAECEVRVGGSWGAKCFQCAKMYKFRNGLTAQRRAVHVLVQLRDGTLSREHEKTICTLARAGGVSVEEYLSLAAQMVDGGKSVRAHLKETFPDLRLSVWESM